MALSFAELKERKEMEEDLRQKERDDRRRQHYSEWLEAMKELGKYTSQEMCVFYVSTMMFEDTTLSEEGKCAYLRLRAYENCHAPILPYFLRRFHDEVRRLQLQEIYHLHRCLSNNTEAMMSGSINGYKDHTHSPLTEYFLASKLLNLQIDESEYNSLRRQAARIEDRRATYLQRRSAYLCLMRYEELFNEYLPRIMRSYGKTGEESERFTTFPYA